MSRKVGLLRNLMRTKMQISRTVVVWGTRTMRVSGYRYKCGTRYCKRRISYWRSRGSRWYGATAILDMSVEELNTAVEEKGL